MNIFGYRITVRKADKPEPPDVGSLPVFLLTRRKLARQVEEYREAQGWNDCKINRIKALRALRPHDSDLIRAKHWIELAFTNYGAGGIA